MNCFNKRGVPDIQDIVSILAAWPRSRSLNRVRSIDEGWPMKTRTVVTQGPQILRNCPWDMRNILENIFTLENLSEGNVYTASKHLT